MTGERPVAIRARGRKRRDILLEAARILLAERESDALTLADVAAHAGIPKSSAYHFYADIIDLYQELVLLLDAELQVTIAAPVMPVETWQDVLDIVIDRAAAFFRNNLAAQKLMLASQSPPAIKRSSRHADIDTSRMIERQIEAQFDLPDIPDRNRIFFHAVEAADLMFGLSLFQYNELREYMVEEAKKMASSYLLLYIPKYIPAKSDNK